jgi:hypothetical protein
MGGVGCLARAGRVSPGCIHGDCAGRAGGHHATTDLGGSALAICIGLGLLAGLLVWLASAHPRWLPIAAGLWLSSGLMMTLIPGLL